MFFIELKKKKLFIFLIFIFFVSSCGIRERLKEKPVVTYVEKPPELLMQDAQRYMRQKNYTEAAKTFEEIDKQHPYSKSAKKSKILAAYAYYLSKKYEDSIFSIDRFISLHPADKSIPYVLYLKGLCYFEQIDSVYLDQTPSKNAKKLFEELIKKFPNSIYAKDAKKKIIIADDQLAAKEMNVGRYYQKKNKHLAAIERFKIVINDYNTTAQTPEALYRLTESYLSLGIITEAKKTTAVLSYNFKESNWYKLSYDLYRKYGYKKNGKKG